MDIQELKSLQDKINDEALKEVYEELPVGLINFTKSETANHRLEKLKSGRKTEQSARVLNSWINQEILDIDTADKGKIKRFNRLTSIWLNIVIEARKFGMPLDYLKQSHRELFKSPIESFSLIKFYILETILRQPKVLIIFEEGDTKVLSLSAYTKYISKGVFSTHLSFKLMDYVIPEYPNNAFNIDFGITNAYDNINKVNLLYYLKTGDFAQMKIFITQTDVRFLENPNMIAENKALMKTISDWKFHKIIIDVDDVHEPVIIS